MVCAAHYLAAGARVMGFHVDYGQRAAQAELSSSVAIAAALRIDLVTVSVSDLPSMEGNVRGRNAFFLCAALLRYPTLVGTIGIGVHAGTPYEDCTPLFIRKMQGLFDLYADGRVRIGAPFLTWAKRGILDYGVALGVPVPLAYSCELGNAIPCGLCASCRDSQFLGLLHAR